MEGGAVLTWDNKDVIVLRGVLLGSEPWLLLCDIEDEYGYIEVPSHVTLLT